MAIALGYTAGYSSQGNDAVVIGGGYSAQGVNSVAVGTNAGFINHRPTIRYNGEFMCD